MKIAVTSQNRKTVTEHAGRCRRFWIYTVENGVITDKNLLELSKESLFMTATAMHLIRWMGLTYF